jgi:hypothetical protein
MKCARFRLERISTLELWILVNRTIVDERGNKASGSDPMSEEPGGLDQVRKIDLPLLPTPCP